MIVVYHGSQYSNIKKLNDNSYVTIFPHVAFNMGLYYKKTKKGWGDANLQKPYGFEPKIKFKKNEKPDGIPTLYKSYINPSNIIIHKNFPFEFRIKKGIPVTKVNNYDKLLKESNKMFNIYIKIIN